MDNGVSQLVEGNCFVGIELGSTTIKAVLIGSDLEPMASGSSTWSSQLVNGYWTYELDAVWEGLQAAYRDLSVRTIAAYGEPIRRLAGLGVSAMMHGYLAFDAEGNLLTPFRTWQNTTTATAAEELTKLFQHNIPQRWSVAHFYQALLNQEPHVGQVAALHTLSSYVHEQLTGRRVVGVGDASGMFPIDAASGSYDAGMLRKFDQLVVDHGSDLRLGELLPEVLPAGASAGALSESGAKLLDPTGELTPGILLCPPEGDAGTGMVATNSVARRSANVSAGTSIFAMVVLEGPLSGWHEEIDLVTTPAGDLVAMAHCNNGTVELSNWVKLFHEVAELLGSHVEVDTVYETLYQAALDAEPDGGNMLAYNYLAGEHVTGLTKGRPLLARTPEAPLNIANFMRTQHFSALGALRVGMDVLLDEGVGIDTMFAHGGLFKTKGVAQRFLAAAMKTPVSVGDLAAEGGAWGMALLAAYRGVTELSLSQWLSQGAFRNADVETIAPSPADMAGFDSFMERYRAGLPVEQAAVAALPN